MKTVSVANKMLVLASMLTLLLSSNVAIAQRSELVLEEIIVTAQRRAESLQDAPVSIVVLGEDELKRQGIEDIGDLQAKIPALNITPFPTQRTSLRLYIRGIGPLDLQVTQDPAVTVNVDEVNLGRATGLATQVADTKQIEVLRGPQGTLFGRNAIGGAINITTNLPDPDQLSFTQELGAGDRSLFRSRTILNVPLADEFAVRGSYVYKKQDGYIKNDGPGNDFYDTEDKAGKLDFLWTPGDAWSIRYTYDFAESDFSNPTPQALVAGALSETLQIPVSSGRLDRLATKDELMPSVTDLSGHGLRVIWEGEHVSLKSITSFREFNYNQFTNLESGSTSPFLRLNSSVSFELRGELDELDQDQFSQELQILGVAGEQLSYVAGLYYFTEDAIDEGASQTTFFAPLPVELFRNEIENTSWAVYGQGDWNPAMLDSKLTLSAGIRYTQDRREATRLFDVGGGGPNSYVGDADADFDNVSYTLIASYALTEKLESYVKLATGYKSGGFNVRASTANGFNQGFDEENLITLELGVKSEFWNNRARLNAALFYSEYDDIQLNLADQSTPTNVRDTNVFNAGEAELQGLELDFTVLLAKPLTVNMSYSYLDAEFTEVIDPADPAISEDDFVFGAPENQFTLGLNYSTPVSFGTLNAGLAYNWIDDWASASVQSQVDDGSSVIDSYGLLGANIGISEINVGKSGQINITLWGRNLTDEEYLTSADLILNVAGAYEKVGFWGEPRSYGIDLIYRFSH